MANKRLPVQVTSDNIIGLLEKKTDKETFHWVSGIIISIIITIIGGAFIFFFKYSDAITDIHEKIARVETQIDDIKHH